jgi:phosphonatase-like hydrolase
VNIELAVLDMAGTTVRDDGVVERSFVEAMVEMGVPAESPQLEQQLGYARRTMGQPTLDVFRTLLPDDEHAVEANRRFEDAFARAVARGEIEPLPGAEAALTALRVEGVRVCLTTGFSRATRHQVLDVLGWHDLVDLALSPEDGLRGQPRPDLVVWAVVRLGVEAVQHVAVVGDTVSDLEAGARAGATIVAGVLTGAHTKEQLEAAPHTHLLHGVDELPGVIAHERRSPARSRGQAS